jgi:hypothetical protein
MSDIKWEAASCARSLRCRLALCPVNQRIIARAARKLAAEAWAGGRIPGPHTTDNAATATLNFRLNSFRPVCDHKSSRLGQHCVQWAFAVNPADLQFL